MDDFFVLAVALLVYGITIDEGKSIRRWVLLGITTLGAIYTQYFSVIPLFVIYAYLGVNCLKRQQFRRFLICCTGIVILYLPQLYLVYKMLKLDSLSSDDMIRASLNVNELCSWSFGTNIKWSAYLPFIAYLVAILLLILNLKKIERIYRNFLVLIAAIYPLTWVICWGISQKMNHFWNNRYMIDALIFAWIFIFIIYSMQGSLPWLPLCVWVGIMCLSSYSITYASEMSTVSYVADAKQKLSQVPEGADVIYNYDTYDTLYKYYLPEANFLWYEDADFSQLSGDSIYMISWGGKMFSKEVMEKYNISVEYLDFFQLEEGVGDVALCKVHFDNSSNTEGKGL